ncbi:lamina-associated polypeptide 2, isoforms beta/delta/epsilon/gamma-like isoform X3 [Polypterus senegalus]|uniref:lamina-associated polypeptide 2, isoforms beta/delta/epsilon/gamma-like isoform X3 n=1 Tax=Polypterus senegalus TaxID=55291 RepID=UPI0019628216|nr:lamina-associated polypeptide 2, isoforms beta/delta/epsilon/gamma-like isoform X3 [Polypterus senegalus]
MGNQYWLVGRSARNEGVDDPSHLSKESLKSELIAHNVALPIGERKKEVYLQLYMKHVYSKKSTDFSSDEEEEPPEEGNVSDQQVEEKVFMKNSKMMDICQMNDEELKAKLLEHGVIPGPIVASTRLVYEKKLLKLISQKSESSSFKNNATVIEDQYSDSEEDEEEMESTMVQKKMKKTAKAIGNHTHVLTENNVKNADVYFLQCFAPCPSMIEPDCDMATYQEPNSPVNISVCDMSAGRPMITGFGGSKGSPLLESNTSGLMNLSRLEHISLSEASTVLRKNESIAEKRRRSTDSFKINNDDKKEDILAELFPNEPRTPTGISATRRKPIKGAAGRPIQFKYNLTEKAQLSSRVESTPATPRQLVPVVIQIVVFLLVVCFLFLIYQAMEVNQDFYVENESHFEAVDQNVPLPVAEEAAQPSSPMAIQE